MFSRLLFPTDCSARARSLVAMITGLDPRPQQVCSVVVVQTRGMEQPLIEAHVARARSDLEELARPLRAIGIDAPTRVLVGRPVDAILATAKDVGSQALVLGSFGKTAMEEILKGSLSADLTRSATFPVLSVRFGILSGRTEEACRDWGSRLFERVLHPTDLSDCSRGALDLLVRKAGGGVGSVDLVHVVDDVYERGDESPEELLDGARAQIDEYASELAEAGLRCAVHVVEGDPVADVLRLAGEMGSTCLVLGSRGKGLVKEAMVGSVSAGILRMANKPVLVVR